MNEAIYVFCLAHPGWPAALEGPDVTGQNPLFVQDFQGIRAVASWAGTEVFCGPQAEVRMQELDWLAPRACRHEQVIEQVLRHSPVLPLPFGTLFSSLASLGNFLESHRRAILGFLDHVAGREEWGVKGVLDRAGAREALAAILLKEQGERLAGVSTGRRYFMEQRIRAGADGRLNAELRRICQGVADELIPGASEFRERRVIAHGASTENQEVILNWAFLIVQGSRADFQARVERANANSQPRGLVLEMSGPWPPYSFAPSLPG